MAQKTGQEEAEFKSQSVPETLSLCVNNCGVTGNPSTNNMCQNCFTSTTTTTSSASSILSSSSSSLTSSGTLKFEKSLRSTTVRQPRTKPDLIPKVDLAAEMTLDTVVAKRVVNRCSGCKRKVGLTGFRCRCGEFFCSEHRYSDRHECSYDYKAAGRVAIARENPVVRAAKIVKV